MRSRIVNNSGQIAQSNNSLPYYDLSGGAGVSDGDKGDITVSGGGTVWTIDASVVTDAKLRDSAASSVIGRQFNTVGAPTDIFIAFPLGSPALLSYSASSDFVFWRYFSVGVLKSDGTDFQQGTIDTADITADAVTYAKMQNVSAASRLVGRGSAAGVGDPEEITLGTNLAMVGTVLNATGGSGGLLSLSQHFITADFTITDAFAAYVTRFVEIVAGFTLTIGANADLEIG